VRILVTGGAGFIGSHTADRLAAERHDVVILDALRPPVHRGDTPSYLTPGAKFIRGDVRDRDLMTKLLKEVDAVYHFAAHQDYLPDFSTFFDVNATSTALLFEIAVAERVALQRVVVASSQAVSGEGLYECSEHGRFTPDMRMEPQLRAGSWNIRCPVCHEDLVPLATPESVANPKNAYAMSKYAQEMIAMNLGRRYGIPAVAMRYSITQGPRQSVYNAYSGACRIFNLHYSVGGAPVVYEDGMSLRDYVNIDDVVDANLLVLDDERAIGRVFNVGGGVGYTSGKLAEIVMRQYGSARMPRITNEYRFGDTRHIVSDISALRMLGWTPRRTPNESVAAYAEWLKDFSGLSDVLDEADQVMRGLGVVRSVGAS
jgi:dTDP-L-rhamnose 4-epimerase